MPLLALSMAVRPHKADVLCQRLLASGLVDELTAAECRGYGRQKGQLEHYQGSEYTIDFLPKVLITGVIDAASKDQVIELICVIARTGRIGDGKIFLQPVAAATGIGATGIGATGIGVDDLPGS